MLTAEDIRPKFELPEVKTTNKVKILTLVKSKEDYLKLIKRSLAGE